MMATSADLVAVTTLASPKREVRRRRSPTTRIAVLAARYASAAVEPIAGSPSTAQINATPTAPSPANPIG